jgi:hypothetical protein
MIFFGDFFTKNLTPERLFYKILLKNIIQLYESCRIITTGSGRKINGKQKI